jgi:hypothetical protein
MKWRTSLVVMTIALGGPLRAQSYGGTNTDSCFVCLTKEEAMQAVDSALLGQSYGRRLPILLAIKASMDRENKQLRLSLDAKDKAALFLGRAMEAKEQEIQGWERAMKAQKRKATKKTFTWVCLGMLAGMLTTEVIGSR